MSRERALLQEAHDVLDGLRVGSIYDTQQADVARVRALIADELSGNSQQSVPLDKQDQLIELVRLAEWVISTSTRQTALNMIEYQKRIRAKFDELGIKRIVF